MFHRIATFFLWYSANIRKILYYTCCGLLAIALLERILIIFSYEPHTAGIDNNFDYPIIRSLDGLSVYPNPSSYPYAVNPYAPLFFIVCKWAAVPLHITAVDTIAVYRLSRFLCLLADIGTCVLIFTMLRKRAKISTLMSISGTAIFFCIISYLGYTINRSDAFFLFFFSATLFMLLKEKNTKSVWPVLQVSALVILCIFSKQNGISLLLLVPAWNIIDKNYRALAYFLLFGAVLFLLSFAYFQFIYSNHFFSQHIIDALRNKIDPRWFYVYIFKLISPTYLSLPLLATVVISIQTISDNKYPQLKKLGILFLLQFFFSNALCLKWGSSLGYYNESLLLSFLIIGSFYREKVIPNINEHFRISAIYLYPPFCVFIFHMTAQLFFFFINSKAEALTKFNEQQQISSYIKKNLGPEDKYVMDLSNPDFNFFKNLLYKESAAPNMDAVTCCTLPDHIFDYTGLVEGLKNGKVAYLIEYKDVQEKSRWGVPLNNYKLDTSFSTYSIFKYSPIVSK